MNYKNSAITPQRRGFMQKSTSKPRKKRRRVFYILAAILALLAITLGIVLMNRNSNSSIVQGTWIYDKYTQYAFDGKGRGYLQLETERYEYAYAISGNKLHLDFMNDTLRDCEYDFSIQNNTLTLIGGEGTAGGQYVLTRN